MRRRLGLALAVLGLALSPAPARACTCAQPASPQAAAERADRVFLGVVERFEMTGTRRQATFRVTTVWKGPGQARVRVTTGAGDGDCGVHFVAGLEYLVYATEAPGRGLETSICTRTAARRDARDDLAVLGPGAPTAGAPAR